MSFSIATPYRSTQRHQNSATLGSAGKSAVSSNQARTDPRWETPSQNVNNGFEGSSWIPSSHASDFLSSLGCAKLPVVKVAPESPLPKHRVAQPAAQVDAAKLQSGLLPQHALRTEMKAWLEHYLGDTLQEHLTALPHQLRVEVKAALQEVDKYGAQPAPVVFSGESPAAAKERERKLRAAEAESARERERTEHAERQLADAMAATHDLKVRVNAQVQSQYELEKMLAAKEAELHVTREMHQTSTNSHGENMSLMEETLRKNEEMALKLSDAERRLFDQERTLNDSHDDASRLHEQHQALMNELIVRKETELQQVKEEADLELRRAQQEADRKMEHMLHEKAKEIKFLLATIEEQKVEPEPEVVPVAEEEEEEEEPEIETEWHELDDASYVCVCPFRMSGVACYTSPDLGGDFHDDAFNADDSKPIFQPSALADDPDCLIIKHGDVVRPHAASSHWLAIDVLGGRASPHTLYAPLKFPGVHGAILFEPKEAYDARTRKVLSDEERLELEREELAAQEQYRKQTMLRTLPETLDAYFAITRNTECASKMALSKEIEQELYRSAEPLQDGKEARAKITEIQRFVDDVKTSAVGKGRGEQGARGWELMAEHDSNTCNELAKVILQGSKYFRHIFGDSLNVKVRTDHDYDELIHRVVEIQTTCEKAASTGRSEKKRTFLQQRNAPYELFRDGCEVLREHFLGLMAELERSMSTLWENQLEKRPPKPTEHLQFSIKTCKPKHIFRIVEKAAHRVGDPGNCSNIRDVVRSRITCSSCTGFVNTLEFLAQRDDVEIVWIEERFSAPQIGEWIDTLVYVRFLADRHRHICEIQLVHKQLMLCCSNYAYESALVTVRRAKELLLNLTGPRRDLTQLWMELIGPHELQNDFSWAHTFNWTTEDNIKLWQGVTMRGSKQCPKLISLNLSNHSQIKGELSAQVVGLISHLRSKGGLRAVDLSNCGHLSLPNDLTGLKGCWPSVTHLDLREIDSLECDLSKVLLPQHVRKVSVTDNGLVVGTRELCDNFRNQWGLRVKVILEKPWKAAPARFVGAGLEALSAALSCRSKRPKSELEVAEMQFGTTLRHKRCANASVQLSHLVKYYRDARSSIDDGQNHEKQKAAEVAMSEQHSFVAQKGLEVIALLARDDNSKLRLTANGAHEAIISAMKSFAGSKAVQQKACWALVNLCEESSENQTRIGIDGSVMEAVVIAMTLFQHDQLVQEYACRAITAIAWKHPANQRNFGHVGACVAVTRALDIFSNDRVVQIRGLRACYALANNHADNAGRLGESGCCRAVVSALEHFREDNEVRRSGCEVVANLAARTPENQTLLGDAGACTAVVSLMRASPHDESVQHYACIAMAYLAKGNAVNQGRLVESGAALGVRSALRIHTVDILHWGCYAVYFLAKDHRENHGRLLEAGIRKAIEESREQIDNFYSLDAVEDGAPDGKMKQEALKWAQKALVTVAPSMKATAKRVALMRMKV